MRGVLLIACSILALSGQQAEAKSPRLWLAELSAITAAADADAVDLTIPTPTPDTKVPRAQCTVCKGTGKIRSGDGISVVDCDSCYPPSAGLDARCHCDPCECDDCDCGLVELASAGDCADGSCAVQKKRGSGSCASGDCATGNCGSGKTRPVVRAATAPVRVWRAVRPVRRAAAVWNRFRPLRRAAGWFSARRGGCAGCQ